MWGFPFRPTVVEKQLLTGGANAPPLAPPILAVFSPIFTREIPLCSGRLSDFWRNTMGKKKKSRKRPCRICGKWFLADPRLKLRQKTCGASDCQRLWHTKKCTDWNHRNRSCFQENYLRDRLRDTDPAGPPQSPSSAGNDQPKLTTPLDYPRRVVQEVIGVQHVVLYDYLARLLLRRVQEVIEVQVAGIQNESSEQPPSGISRGDGQMHPPQSRV